MRKSLLTLATVAALVSSFSASAQSTASEASAASAVAIIAVPVIVSGAAAEASSVASMAVSEAFSATITSISEAHERNARRIEARQKNGEIIRMDLPVDTVEKHHLQPGMTLAGQPTTGGAMVITVDGKPMAVTTGATAPTGLSKNQPL